MKWAQQNDLIKEDDTGDLVCVLADGYSELQSTIIKNAPQIFTAMMDFVESVDKGSFKPKKAYEELKSIMDTIPTYIKDEFNLQRVSEQG